MNKRTHASTSFRRFLSLAVFLITFLLLPAETFGQASATRKKPTAARTAQTRRTSQPYKRPANAAQKSNPQANSVNSLIRKLLNDMVHVKGGTFMKGSDAEHLTHTATVSDFYICKYEVTQALWKAVMGSNPSHFKGNNLPVEMVSYRDCWKFIDKLNEMTGKKFRFPTEAEWTYAAHGGNKSKNFKYSGSNNLNSVAWHKNNSLGRTHAVGTKSPNELGLYDMSGNVHEWTSTSWGQSVALLVERGGSWNSSAIDCCVYGVGCTDKDNRQSSLGLRLVASLLTEEDKAAEEEAVQQAIPNLLNDMVHVDGGTFIMGDLKGYGKARPTHRVTLGSFHICKYEVTQALWKAVMGSNPSKTKDSNFLPVENVSWDDCQKFIRKLNEMTGKEFRLPTEAEWEYAARGGSKSKGYEYSGSNDADSVAWNKGWNWSDENSDIRHPQPVGKKFPNELGLYDMSGNVWEWCSDWYGGYSSSAQTNPKGPFSGEYRVMRGGSWSSYRSNVTVSIRLGVESNEIRDNLGLRLAASWLTEEEKQKFEADEKRFQEEQKKVIDSVFSEKDNMVYIKGGKFIMGRPNSTIERFKLLVSGKTF